MVGGIDVNDIGNRITAGLGQIILDDQPALRGADEVDLWGAGHVQNPGDLLGEPLCRLLDGDFASGIVRFHQIDGQPRNPAVIVGERLNSSGRECRQQGGSEFAGCAAPRAVNQNDR
ncbi:Uncharacterised protein [Mycobacteroides abscessus subsp. abscessus]|nr:Uncharacterised protein [Mycobacteroides abscessus subsp. abscessus]